ncbi:HIT domain [Nesidiocoris tenuis]|uniref:Adenosine 5'-monophosphoramidase HINT3 n=1 Tax=Nesidiocoris tenuis TaxID=355587 RepID=A0ABN7BCM2_9HEMI|nr:HIT domain [Nesidiocoris tenuis]
MAGSNCVFCGIVANDEKKQIIFQDDTLVVFSDIRPAAKHHYLIVTKEHISDCKVLTPEQKPLVELMVSKANEILTEHNGSTENSRLGFHWPPFHTIGHLHLHAIAPVGEMGFVARMIFRENSWWFVSPEYVLARLSNEKKSPQEEQAPEKENPSNPPAE